MAEPHWTSYVGMASGIIGAITGIAGAIMGFVSYRRSNQLKSLDLRLELRKAASDLRLSHSQLNDLINHANNSRRAVAAARGRFHSGMMERWNNEIEEDRNRVENLSNSIPSSEEVYSHLSATELETKLVEIHNLQHEVKNIKAKYDAAIAEDDNERNHIREDVRARVAPRNSNN